MKIYVGNLSLEARTRISKDAFAAHRPGETGNYRQGHLQRQIQRIRVRGNAQ